MDLDNRIAGIVFPDQQRFQFDGLGELLEFRDRGLQVFDDVFALAGQIDERLPIVAQST